MAIKYVCFVIKVSGMTCMNNWMEMNVYWFLI